MTLEMVEAGVITGVHGITGEVKFNPQMDLQPLQGVEVRLIDSHAPDRLYKVENARPHKGYLILKLKGCDTRNDAELLRGRRVMVPPDVLTPLVEGEYLIGEIIGLKVYTLFGDFLGEIEEVIKTGANDVYVVGKHLIPAIHDVVREIDMERRRMVIDPLDGMLE